MSLTAWPRPGEAGSAPWRPGASGSRPPARARSGIALISAVLGIGGALALPLVGVVAEHAHYHLLFWICFVSGAACLAGTGRFVPEAPVPVRGTMDTGGAVLLAVALVAAAAVRGRGAGLGRRPHAGLLAAAVVPFTVFVIFERRRDSPVVDLRVNARPPLLLANPASVAVGFALVATLLGSASYVQAPRASGYGFGSSILVSRLRRSRC